MWKVGAGTPHHQTWFVSTSCAVSMEVVWQWVLPHTSRRLDFGRNIKSVSHGVNKERVLLYSQVDYC